eukprot:14933011-Ditylum_brightwellii.AAC.1
MSTRFAWTSPGDKSGCYSPESLCTFTSVYCLPPLSHSWTLPVPTGVLLGGWSLGAFRPLHIVAAFYDRGLKPTASNLQFSGLSIVWRCAYQESNQKPSTHGFEIIL